MPDSDPVLVTLGSAKRIAAHIRRVPRGQVIRRRALPPGEGRPLEHGKPTAAFKTGTTITLDPCDVDGEDNERDNVIVWLAADRATVETPYATSDILAFVRLPEAFDEDDDPDTANVEGILVGFQTGSHASPTACSVTPEGNETAAGTAWDRANQADDGCTVNVTSRIVYNHAGDKKLYGFFQTLTFDATGKLADVSTETRYEIDAAEDCP